MEERLKVYVRGDRHRGKEVIKMLTDLGAKNEWNYFGNVPEIIYFIGHNGVIENASDDSDIALLMEEYCREIELPKLWKDGDVIINDDSHMYAVFSHIDVGSTFVAYMQASEDGVVDYENGVRCDMEKYRLATDEEVNRFYELLHKHGKDWDSKKKQLVNWKWKPKQGDDYYYINSVGRVLRSELFSCGIDKCETFFGFGNYYRTREEAEDMAERIKKLLNGE